MPVLFSERHFKHWFALLGSVLIASCSASEGRSPDDIMSNDKELIVLAGPPEVDDYYADIHEEIRAFHIGYAQQIAQHDDVLVLVSKRDQAAYQAVLGSNAVVTLPQLDIWMRDFTLSNAVSPVMFRYTAAGQGGGRGGQKAADEVQDEFAAWLEEAGVVFAESDWLNDGGNFVDDYTGNVVISRKFLADNNVSEKAARTYLTSLPGIENVAIIDADEQGGLEHADGVVSFIEPGVLVINSYAEDPDYAAQLKADLRAGIPGVTIHEITTPYDGSTIYDERFGSACGLYTNMLVTSQRIYFPQFAIPEDVEALAAMREWTEKEIIPVQSGEICQMGGGVRCMSWQVRGENAARLIKWARTKG